MTEFSHGPYRPESPSEPAIQGEPEAVEHSIDALMQRIWDRPQVERAMDHLLDRQKELVQQMHDKRELEERLTPSEETELDEINNTILTIQHLFERYDSKE